MTGTLLGFAIIAAGAFVAWLYRQWARADADSLKKMSEREFHKSQPNRKAGAARVAGSGAARDKSPRGIRLLAGNDGFIRELIYIEQPEVWLPDQT